MPRRFVLCAALLVAVVWTAAAMAQQRPCADDVKRLCPEVTPSTGSLRDCLEPHFDSLSPACQKQIKRTERRSRSIRGRRKHVHTARASIATPSPHASPAKTPAK